MSHSDERTNPAVQTLIMTVDDSRTIRMLLRTALTDLGFDVMEAEDGQQALDQLAVAEIEPAVIITDINMPRLDGFGLIERLRQQSAHQYRPILVLSTESSDEKKARARRAGATGWIVKPFDSATLAAAIRRVLH